MHAHACAYLAVAARSVSISLRICCRRDGSEMQISLTAIERPEGRCSARRTNPDAPRPMIWSGCSSFLLHGLIDIKPLKDIFDELILFILGRFLIFWKRIKEFLSNGGHMHTLFVGNRSPESGKTISNDTRDLVNSKAL